MNMIAKIILAADSLLLVFVFLALIENGIFRESDTVCAAPCSSRASAASPPRLNSVSPPQIYSPKMGHPTSHGGPCEQKSGDPHIPTSSFVDRRCSPSSLVDEFGSANGHCSSSASKRFCGPYAGDGGQYTTGAGSCCHFSLWDFIFQLIPCNGIFGRLFSFFLSVACEITFHDVIFFYILMGGIYFAYNFYTYIPLFHARCKTETPSYPEKCPQASTVKSYHQKPESQYDGTQRSQSHHSHEHGRHDYKPPDPDRQPPVINETRKPMHHRDHKQRRKGLGHEINHEPLHEAATVI
ncbi:hypothetical protein MDAP_000948 [Mitosporidium daphniae]